jgi:hypothetical protein
MFQYQDPAGRNFLSNSAAANNFRQGLQAIYESFARRINSGFTWLEAFSQLSGSPLQPVSVEWFAFPLTSTASDAAIDTDRLTNQDEYVEWQALKKNGALVTVTFTTEFPEYFEAFAADSAAALITAIKDVIPTANPTTAELFGPGFDPSATDAVGRAQAFRRRLASNPWNNGTKGILCLMQQFNTLSALFNLVATCGVVKNQGTPENTCSLVGGACGPGRASDPAVCAEAQRAVRAGVGFTLSDPAGVRILKLEGVWRINTTTIDINNPAQNQGTWVVSRGGRRGVLTLVPGLTLDGQAIVTGAQVSHKLRVASHLLAAPNAALPDWARIGIESTSRGPE